VETEQGLSVALVATGPLDAVPGLCGQNDGGTRQNESRLQEAVSLPRILRAASQQDWDKERQNRELAREAVAFCRRCIAERGLDMKLVDVEVFFDRSKLIFYFTAPSRIDFRELVKDLVQEYRTRIELRQIGVRHETQMVGALGNCGMTCCCRRYLRKFASVTIRMAKEQNLFLNPAKISGICGRLLCCLAYEQDNYDNFHKACPRLGKKYRTCRGGMKVLRANMFRNALVALTENNEELELTLEEWQALSPQRAETQMPAAQEGHSPAALSARTDEPLLVVSAAPDILDDPDVSEDLPDG
jgi:cell fate regulator YaaT (PSP1 superfamily)